MQMSSNQDLYTQLRELRKKIMAMIKNLPDIAFANLSPETFDIKQFLGRNRLGVGTYNANIYLADAQGNKVDGVEVSLNAPTKVLTDEDLGRVMSELFTRPLKVHVQYGTEDLWISVNHYAMTKVTAQDISNIIYFAYPVDYLPDSPPKCEFQGSVWRNIDRDRGFEIIIVIGQVGYYSAGKLVQWNGTAVLLLLSDSAQVTKVVTPRGYIAGNPGEKVVVVFSPVWALYAKSAVVSIVEPIPS